MAELRRFGDFATFKYGKMPDKKKLTESGKYPVYSGYRYVGYYDEYNTEANQIIVVARGVGGTGDVKLTKERCYLTNLSISADIDENIALPEFIYYYYLPHNLRYLDSGSAQSQITISDLEKVLIPLPSLGEQRAICGYMKMLDRKIEINEAVNENLTEQARAIFQAWFIDYEPFGGEVPSDWYPYTLGQIADIKTDSWSPAKNPDVVVEHYSIPAFDEQHYPVFEIASGIKSNKYILNPDSVMISKLNPNTKRIWRPMCLSAHPVCSTEFIVYEAKKQEQRDYIYSILDSVPFLNYLCSHTTGSTNSRQRATPKSTLDFSLCLPPDSIIEDFCRIVTPIYDLIASNIVENQSLAKTRDSLLPRLISGELDVSGLAI